MLKKDAEILVILSETLLAGLIDALRTGEFQPSPDGQIASHETLIGELTYTEKAIFSAIELLNNKARKIADAKNAMFGKADCEGGEVDMPQELLDRAEFETITKLCKSLSELMWYTIKKRINIASPEIGGFAIRDGYQLVSFPPQQRDEDEMLAELFMGGCGGRRLSLADLLGGLAR